MADIENEAEISVEETPVEKVEIDPSTLTPTSPEVISRYTLTSVPACSGF
jgi:hypothetical protein